MRTKLLFATVFVLLTTIQANATYIDINENTTINSDLNAIVRVHGSAQLTVLSGVLWSVHLLDSSAATVYGGIGCYTAEGANILKLYGGNFDNWYVTYSNSLAQIYVYGQNFQTVPASDDHTSVFLNGNWLNGTAFHIYFRELPQPFEQALGTNIFLVPEPCTVGLFGFGFLVMRRIIKTFHK